MTADAHNAVVALVAMYSQLLEAQEKQFQAVAAELGRAARHADEQRAAIAQRDKDLAEAKAEVTRVHDEALRVLDARHKRVAELEAELRSLRDRQDQAGQPGDQRSGETAQQAEPIQGAGEEAPGPGGVLQEPAPEEVKPPCEHPMSRQIRQVSFGQFHGLTCGACGEWVEKNEPVRKGKKNDDIPF